jgi:HPt (histidine-containing phosphotransfer) domain-containing protein
MNDVLIDRAILDDLFEHIGADAAGSVIELFLGEARDYVERISTASTDPTARDTARKAAHSLKSSAGQIGASALATAAERIERAAETEKDLSELISPLRKCADGTAAMLSQLLSGRG